MTNKNRKAFKPIEWVCKLGESLEDDRKLFGFKSMVHYNDCDIYDFDHRDCRCLDKGELQRSGHYRQTKRTVRTGDYYVHHVDGSWDIMDKQTLGWYRRKLREIEICLEQRQEAKAKAIAKQSHGTITWREALEQLKKGGDDVSNADE